MEDQKLLSETVAWYLLSLKQKTPSINTQIENLATIAYDPNEEIEGRVLAILQLGDLANKHALLTEPLPTKYYQVLNRVCSATLKKVSNLDISPEECVKVFKATFNFPQEKSLETKFKKKTNVKTPQRKDQFGGAVNPKLLLGVLGGISLVTIALAGYLKLRSKRASAASQLYQQEWAKMAPERKQRLEEEAWKESAERGLHPRAIAPEYEPSFSPPPRPVMGKLPPRPPPRPVMGKIPPPPRYRQKQYEQFQAENPKRFPYLVDQEPKW